MNISIRILTLFIVAITRVTLAGEQSKPWNEFRGPQGNGVAEGASLPVELGNQAKWKWETQIEGIGWSSPVSNNYKIWLTTAVTQEASAEVKAAKLKDLPDKDNKALAGSIELKAICIDAKTGQVLYSKSLAKFDDPDPIHPLNTYASPTPFLDEDRIYCHFGTYGTWCLNAISGETIWTTRIELAHSVGPGSSPVVINDRLILVCDGTDQQFVAGLDAKTGKELWRTARPPSRTREPESQKSYCTPTAVTVRGQMQVVIPGAQWVCGYDPNDGTEIWRVDHGDGFSLCGRPVIAGDMMIFSTGYTRPEMIAVRFDGIGDVSKSHLIWRTNRGAPSKPSPVVVGDSLYMVSDSGVLTKLRVADGSSIWQKRLSGNYSASPIVAGDRLYFCSHEGMVFVLGAGEEFEKISESELPPRILASPAVIENDLIIRTEQSLIRITK